MKILIVEDEDVLSSVLAEKFKNEGYEVMVANNGDDAKPKAIKFRPDAILLDLMIPKKRFQIRHRTQVDSGHCFVKLGG